MAINLRGMEGKMSENPCKDLYDEMVAIGEEWTSIINQKSGLFAEFDIVTQELLDKHRDLHEREGKAWEEYLQKNQEYSDCMKRHRM